jgi:hypothetical protein
MFVSFFIDAINPSTNTSLWPSCELVSNKSHV